MYVDPQYFIHENDRKALEALQGIPGFKQVIKAFMKYYSERVMTILNMSGKVRLSEKQCPRIYNLLPPICEKLGIPVPELYLEMNPYPNAYTSGDTNIFITVTSGLVETMNEEEIQTVLAHECGHILCHHVLYHTVGRFILSGAAALLGLGGLVNTALSAAFFYWMRCSEFSADRVAALYCGGPDRVAKVMLRLASGSSSLAEEIDADLFMQQAAEYASYVGDSAWNKILELITLMNETHPFLAVRAFTINDWCGTETFRRVSDYVNGKTAALPNLTGICPRCGNPVDLSGAICPICSCPLHVVQAQPVYPQQGAGGVQMQPGFYPNVPQGGYPPQGLGGYPPQPDYYANAPQEHPVQQGLSSAVHKISAWGKQTFMGPSGQAAMGQVPEDTPTQILPPTPQPGPYPKQDENK